MHELLKKTCEALKDIEHSGSLNIMDNADRKLVSELVDLKKNILKVQKLEDEMEGYSEGDGTDDSVYGRGSSYANRGQHYVRGHYSRDGGRDGYSMHRDDRGRYSRGDGRDKMIGHLKAAWDDAPEQDRQEFMRYLENA